MRQKWTWDVTCAKKCACETGLVKDEEAHVAKPQRVPLHQVREAPRRGDHQIETGAGPGKRGGESDSNGGVKVCDRWVRNWG